MNTNALSARFWRKRGYDTEIIQTYRVVGRYDPFRADLLAVKRVEAAMIQSCRTGKDVEKHRGDALAGARRWARGKGRTFYLQAWRRRVKAAS